MADKNRGLVTGRREISAGILSDQYGSVRVIVTVFLPDINPRLLSLSAI